MTFSKTTLTSNISLALLVVLLVFLANLKFKQYQNQKEIEKQTLSLKQQADSLQKQNDDLNQSIQYLNSLSFKERVARQQLNYKKQGEIVYGFSDVQGTQDNTQAVDDKTPNAEKWWNYFFADQS